MHRSEFTYELPADLIAQAPLPERSASRLLCLDGLNGIFTDRQFSHLPELLAPNDLLVFNDTRVVPARLLGHKDTGGQVEIFLERLLDDDRFLAQARASKALRPESIIHITDHVSLRVRDRVEGFFELQVLNGPSAEELFIRYGKTPLPPYIRRDAGPEDCDRYQTVFARVSGAVAAPTAGLHFDRELLNRLTQRGITLGFVTLHVGAGTFQPVRTDQIEAHHMHSECYEITAKLAQQVEAARAAGGRVIAVGTTVVRALESVASVRGAVLPVQGTTDIFIYPGYRFQVVDALVTNFHLPESTLLMLVCAFGGQHQVMEAYRHAVAERYRFFSYGDAMWVSRRAV